MENQPQTIMILKQGNNVSKVTEYLENQIEANGGKFSMDFCDLPEDLRPTDLEFRNINGIPKRKIIMNFTQGCPKSIWGPVTEYISNQIEANNGKFTLQLHNQAPSTALNV